MRNKRIRDLQKINIIKHYRAVDSVCTYFNAVGINKGNRRIHK